MNEGLNALTYKISEEDCGVSDRELRGIGRDIARAERAFWRKRGFAHPPKGDSMRAQITREARAAKLQQGTSDL